MQKTEQMIREKKLGILNLLILGCGCSLPVQCLVHQSGQLWQDWTPLCLIQILTFVGLFCVIDEVTVGDLAVDLGWDWKGVLKKSVTMSFLQEIKKLKETS